MIRISFIGGYFIGFLSEVLGNEGSFYCEIVRIQIRMGIRLSRRVWVIKFGIVVVLLEYVNELRFFSLGVIFRKILIVYNYLYL